jgi:hypothetical protein
MSNLEDILKEYRHSCFLAKDLNLNDKAVILVVNQQIVTYGKIKALMLDIGYSVLTDRAADQAYAAGLGVSEWEGFMTEAETVLLNKFTKKVEEL